MSKQGANKTNILSFDKVKELHNKKFEMKEAEVELDGEMFSFKYYEELPKSKKTEFIVELLEFVIQLQEDETLEDIGTGGLTTYTIITMIDKLTDIETPEDPKERIIYAGHLIDLDLHNDILDVFDEDYIEELMSEATERMQEQTSQMLETLDRLIEQSEQGEIEDLATLRLVDKEPEEEKEN